MAANPPPTEQLISLPLPGRANPWQVDANHIFAIRDINGRAVVELRDGTRRTLACDFDTAFSIWNLAAL